MSGTNLEVTPMVPESQNHRHLVLHRYLEPGLGCQRPVTRPPRKLAVRSPDRPLTSGLGDDLPLDRGMAEIR